MKHRIISILLILTLACGLCASLSGCALATFSLISGGEKDPVSAEDKQADFEKYSNTTVYWSKLGKVYHLYDDCDHLNANDVLYYGTVEQAAEAGKERVCKTCAERFHNEHN